VRPALIVLLVVTGGLYLWDLSASGWANAFYSAAVQAGTKSWKAFFFGSSDASNFITVDKPPGALWVMELSARVFGVNSWSILAPQALEGVATVGLVYLCVRRWFSPAAGLIAGSVVALTPVAALMFRYNNPDALLVLLLTGSVYCTIRALERAGPGWLLAAGALVGMGFLTKMMQALIVLPVIGLVYLLAAPTGLARRVGHIVAAGIATVVAGGWWVAAVVLTPAGDRPYIGGSQDNSLLNLVFGYNGFGRLTGHESGSVGGSPGPTGMWGPTGWNRLFLSAMGGQVSWLIPASLVALVTVLWVTRRSPRTDRTRAAFVLWGGVLVLTGAMISFAQGIIHPYYTVALAPAIGALVGMGSVELWRRRDQLLVRGALALAVAATTIWAYVLLDRTPGWLPPLRIFVAVAGAGAAAGLLAAPSRRARLGPIAVAVALAAVLAGPLFFTLDTVGTPHAGALPAAGPGLASGPGGPGGPGGRFGGPGAGGFPGAPPGLRPSGRSAATALPGGLGAPPPAQGRGFPPGIGGFGGTAGGAPSGAGFLGTTTPGRQLVRLLERGADRYRWVAATVNSNSAAGYQLASGDPVMAIGGFNGTDPAPTLTEFERDVRQGKIHYFIAGGSGIGPGGPGGGGQSDASGITSWVEAHYQAHTVDGTTVYDLST